MAFTTIGSKCFSCKKQIDFTNPKVDKNGNVVCISCGTVILPKTQESKKNISGFFPTCDYYLKHEFDLPPIQIG